VPPGVYEPCQKQASAENTPVRKIVPLLANKLLNGVVSQYPITAQQRCGAEFKRPASYVDRGSTPSIPKRYL